MLANWLLYIHLFCVPAGDECEQFYVAQATTQIDCNRAALVINTDVKNSYAYCAPIGVVVEAQNPKRLTF